MHCLRWSLILPKQPISYKQTKMSKSIKNRALMQHLLGIACVFFYSRPIQWTWFEGKRKRADDTLGPVRWELQKSQGHLIANDPDQPLNFLSWHFPLCCRWIGRLSPPPGSLFLPRRSDLQVKKPTLEKYNNVDGKKEQSRHLSNVKKQ